MVPEPPGLPRIAAISSGPWMPRRNRGSSLNLGRSRQPPAVTDPQAKAAALSTCGDGGGSDSRAGPDDDYVLSKHRCSRERLASSLNYRCVDVIAGTIQVSAVFPRERLAQANALMHASTSGLTMPLGQLVTLVRTQAPASGIG